MKKMKFFSLTLAVLLGAFTLFSCANDESGNDPEPSKQTVDVTFYDGENVLKTEKVEKGGKATNFTPEKAEYDFTGWYATPNFVHKFDFEQAINKPTKVFGLFSKSVQPVDNREYYLVGSGQSSLLSKSNWGKVYDDSLKMTKAEDKNEYTFTTNLFKDDQFQFSKKDWKHQRGYGYLQETALADGTEVFTSSQTIGDNSSLRVNIKVLLDGNYTFTLKTHPADDTYETNNAAYTEAEKEAFNINYNDKITWVRNGDSTEEKQTTVTEYYIKGAGITDWKNMYNASTKLVKADGKAKLEVYLKNNEEFMFVSTITIGSEPAKEGTEFIRGSQLDEASKDLFKIGPSGNMTTKKAGTYVFTYDLTSKKLNVTLDETKSPVAADYYIDGTFGSEEAWKGYCFNEKYKLAENKGKYTISNVSMKKDSELTIQSFKKDATSRGEWGTDTYTGLGSYNFTYVSGAGENFSAVGGNNNNIKVLVAGSYDITFDPYSKIITIVAHTESKDTLDIYVKGNEVNGWKHEFKEDYRMKINADETAYELEITVTASSEFGLEVHPKGETTGYGTFVNTSKMGTLGDANELFGSTGNFKCTTPGTYKIVYTIATETVDIYKVVK